MNNDMISLAERCEAATGPCEEMDADIALAVEWKHRSGKDWHLVLPWERPRYTASIDSAMTLIDSSTFFHISRLDADGDGRSEARVYPNRHVGDDYKAEAATPALALCAASLRARALSTVSRGGVIE